MNALVIVSSLGVLALLAEIFRFRKALYPMVMVGLIAAFVVNLFDWNTGYSYFHYMMVYDNYAVAFNQVILGVAIGWFLLAPPFFNDENHVTDYIAVTTFAIAGALLLAAFNHISMLFIGIEILSISMYVMAGSRKSDLSSNEAAFKYFLMGSFSTGFLLFGIALVYGASGSFYMQSLNSMHSIREFVLNSGTALPAFFMVGMLLMMVGMVFKVSAFPFHFWAPDVYQGSPTPITALMSTIVKVAAVSAFFRLFVTCFSTLQAEWITILTIISVLTILVGNITALFQKDLKRMLAYSSVSHAGYLLFAIIAINRYSAPSLIYYSIAYSFATLAAFAVLMIVSERTGNTQIDSLKGLMRNKPFLGISLVVSMFSLAGIPPLAGFFAKYYLFTAALSSGHVWLVLLGIVGTLVGVYYYFRVAVAVFQDGDDTNAAPYTVSVYHTILLVLSLLITVVLGVVPNLLLGLW